ncbi:hypothetical protein PHLCEN_2v3772 [Hermanssonia centrifuga]|uniref:SH3 domain-containing protein n=1 Tax=Hermanssonia centrifuga TaxID=98765 RepID=A0A2R6QBJ7_9APHY|nr:hypothetical protein PHLCEN_2v3772 [Hermanssonia centrifuga]
MAPSDPQTAALLAHVFSQTQANISFLAAQNYISPTDASELISRLTTAQSRGNTDASLANSMQALAVVPTNTGRRSAPPPPPPRTQRARAVWAYNEDGREPNDLSFSGGEIVEIVDETNADWWTGKCRGRQGLFPSNHVEKIDSSASVTLPPPAPMSPVRHLPQSMPPQPMASYPPQGYAPGYAEPKQSYGPYGGYNVPPPAPVAPVQVVEVQAQPPPKKNRFGGLGNTMANAAAGGVGFGAGE